MKKIFRKVSQCRKKLKGGTLWDFSTSILSQNIKKNEGGTLWGKKFRKKSHSAEKNLKRENSLVSPGMVCYAKKEKKLFWFSSLGQMYQFGTIKFCRTCRTILVSSCGLKKKSHYISRVSLHEAPTKNTDEKP